MKRLLGTRRRKLGAVLAVLVLIVVSAAVAAWLISTPAGSGRGKVASLQAPSVSAPASFTGAGDLAPGGNGNAQVLVTNPNGVPLTFVSAGDNGAGTFTPTSPATCPASNFTFSGAATTATPAIVPANATNFAMTINGLFHLSATAPTGCQGQEVLQTGGIVVNWTTG